jgi:DNA-binding MarR family transcriptional regulator
VTLDAPFLASLIRERRRRDLLFGEALFGEPAWDILLDLAWAEAVSRHRSVTDACIAAAVPHTTALRHIKLLVEGGLVTRTADPADRRRYHLRLTSSAHQSLQEWAAGLAPRMPA